jgi:RNA polymerase sigma-70 factor (ECF subfamily)
MTLPAERLDLMMRELTPSTLADDDAWARALYDEHAGYLQRFVVRLTGGDRHRAEEIVQETLLRAWNSRAQLEKSSGTLRPWLCTVARRLVIDEHRKRQARPEEIHAELPDTIPAPEGVDRLLSSVVVADALRTISDMHREVLIETHFRGRTVYETAEVLAIPVGTVKSRLYYALRALRVALEERGVVTPY